ncbi:MAG: hypothetical protein H5T60_09305 [Anaerolineae bacterium]|nr:hypothetical protein [Anaerolineae bacterium]
MAEKAWKRTEREVAKRLGGQRIPVSGRARGSAPDVATTWAAIEVKSRRKLPLWLLDAIAQAEAAAKPGQVAVAILHQHGCRYDDSIVVMRLRDFTRLTRMSE